MAEPALPLTVSLTLWEAFADQVRPTFADSFLTGATLAEDRLTTRTWVAANRIMADARAVRALRELGIILCTPDGQTHRDWYRKRLGEPS